MRTGILATAWWQGISAQRWVGPANLLMVGLIAFSAAQLTWRAMPGGNPAADGPAPMTVPRLAAQQQPRLQSVADLSLFGRADAMAESGPVEAPQTSLNLSLRGVLATGYQPAARAIIATAAGIEESYKVGDGLPGGAVLDQVHADRVILKRSGRFEALYLPKETGSTSGDSQARAGYVSPGGVAANDESSLGDSAAVSGDLAPRMQEYRERILKDPQEAFSLARVQPVMEAGKLKGYKLSPNKEKQLFRQAGLRPGDVVTSVNGIALDDPATVGKVMSQLSTAQELTLTIDRGGQQETLVVPFGQ